MTLSTLCLTPESWMDLRAQSTVGCFPDVVPFFQFSVAQMLVRWRKEFINNFVFPTWACFNNNNNNNYNNNNNLFYAIIGVAWFIWHLFGVKTKKKFVFFIKKIIITIATHYFNV